MPHHLTFRQVWLVTVDTSGQQYTIRVTPQGPEMEREGVGAGLPGSKRMGELRHRAGVDLPPAIPVSGGQILASAEVVVGNGNLDGTNHGAH